MTTREWIALIFVIAGYLLYPILNHRPSRPIFYRSFDDHIPLVPLFIYPYLLLHPLKIITIFLLLHTPLFFPYLISTGLIGWSCAVMWYFYPNGVKRPEQFRLQKNLTHKILSFIYVNDGDSNGLPSAHVAYATCIGYYLAMQFPLFALPIIIVNFTIALSTLFTKQHYVLDIPAGLVVGIGSIILTQICIG